MDEHLQVKKVRVGRLPLFGPVRHHILGVFVRSERHVTAILKTPSPKAATCAGQTYRFVHVNCLGAPSFLIAAIIVLVVFARSVSGIK
jgi:hypothetical protein